MGAEQLKIIYNCGTLSPELALKGIQAVLADSDVPLTGFTLYDEPVNLPAVLPKLERSKRTTFNLAGQGFEFLLGSVAMRSLDFLEIKSEAAPLTPWDDWVAQFFDSRNFAMAWVVDHEYDFWQNAEDPLEYRALGKSYEHLPMKSNGLPYPVEQQIIDTSANPGRWLFRDGFIEAVGAVMWLGEQFWSLTGARKQDILAQKWLTCKEMPGAALRVAAANSPFASAAGAERELQERLRVHLFPKAS
jgi:hypothetical protein